MKTRFLLVALFLLPLPQRALARQGDVERGKLLWLKTEHVECRECHGDNGEGHFGPDLAGRGLTRAQFIQAVRKPWGIMPAYAESQISDGELDDLMALFRTLPAVAQPGPWRRTVPANASPGLAAATTTGCTQCHAPAFNNGRGVMGAIGADFEWFRGIVYNHPAAYPPTQAMLGEKPFERLAMGSFSTARVPEATLRDIWSYITDLGFRARMRGQLSAGTQAANGVTYRLDVENTGVAGKGLAAEDVTVSVVVPMGATVVATTGAGYQGVRRDDQLKGDVAVWTVARMAPKDRQSYTLTLSQGGTQGNNVRGNIRWMRPAVKTGPNDVENIAPAPLTPSR